VGARVVEGARGEERVALADELEAAQEEDVDDRGFLGGGEEGFERLDDGELDLGAVAEGMSTLCRPAWAWRGSGTGLTSSSARRREARRRRPGSCGTSSGCEQGVRQLLLKSSVLLLCPPRA